MPAALMNIFYIDKNWYGFNLCMWYICKALKFSKNNNKIKKYYPLRKKFGGERL